MFGFENLTVWQKAIDFSDRVYVTTRRFPDDERFGLTSQLRRASVSISSNIAEGSGRSSKTDFARFVEIGFGSLMESVSHLFVARRQSFVSQAHFDDLYSRAQELARMLSGLRTRLLAQPRAQSPRKRRDG